VNGLEHDVQGKLGVLEYRADLGGELLTALATFIEAEADSTIWVFLLGLPRTPSSL
jgi:hypothetical protein